MFKLSKKDTRNVSDIFKVNNKDIETSAAFSVNFEHISTLHSTVIIAKFEQIASENI